VQGGAWAAGAKLQPLDVAAIAEEAVAARSREGTPKERTPVAEKVKKMNRQQKAVNGGPVAPAMPLAHVQRAVNAQVRPVN
jgi:hypothetical protein